MIQKPTERYLITPFFPSKMHKLSYQTKEKYATINITRDLKNLIKKENIKSGLCIVYVAHATASIVINENYDPNIQIDLHNALKELIKEGNWLHDQVDGNAAAHIKASILGPSETLIISNSQLVLGQWQDIMLLDFDGPRQRNVFVTVIKDV